MGKVPAVVTLSPLHTGLCRGPPTCQVLPPPHADLNLPDKYIRAPGGLDNAVLSPSLGHCEFALSRGSNCLLAGASLVLRDPAVTRPLSTCSTQKPCVVSNDSF